MERKILKTVERLIEKRVILEEDREVYMFGVKQGIVLIINFVTILIIGLISEELWNLLIFTGAYLLLRQYSGGYHAKSEWGCFILSTLMMIVSVALFKAFNLKLITIFILLGMASGVLIIFSPVEDDRKPLEEIEVKVYKRRLIRILMIELIGIAVTAYNLSSIAKMMIIAILMIAFMVLLGFGKNKLRGWIRFS